MCVSLLLVFVCDVVTSFSVPLDPVNVSSYDESHDDLGVFSRESFKYTYVDSDVKLVPWAEIQSNRNDHVEEHDSDVQPFFGDYISNDLPDVKSDSYDRRGDESYVYDSYGDAYDTYSYERLGDESYVYDSYGARRQWLRHYYNEDMKDLVRSVLIKLKRLRVRVEQDRVRHGELVESIMQRVESLNKDLYETEDRISSSMDLVSKIMDRLDRGIARDDGV